MPPKTTDIVQYSKENAAEDPNDFEDILEKQKEISRNSHDWESLGCGICHFPRTEHQKLAQKHRLCKPFLAFLLVSLDSLTVNPPSNC